MSASSIGVVVAGLQELKQLMIESSSASTVIQNRASCAVVDDLISKGSVGDSMRLSPTSAFRTIPPNNVATMPRCCSWFIPRKSSPVRRPTRSSRTCSILSKGRSASSADIGDSFWCTNYRSRLSEADRTRDYSDGVGSRDALLAPGEEAQWCIFDPIISIYYGNQYRKTKNPDHLSRQVEYFNRSLGQVTGSHSRFGPFLCPELYHVEDGKVEPSDATPLLWTQGNLGMALKAMEESLR